MIKIKFSQAVSGAVVVTPAGSAITTRRFKLTPMGRAALSGKLSEAPKKDSSSGKVETRK